MTQPRVLRRALQDQDRIRLGVLQRASSTAPSAAADRPTASQQALERSLQEAAQLRSQLDQVDHERRQLRAALGTLQAEITAAKQDANQQGYAEGSRKAQVEMQRELTDRATQWQKTLEATSGQYEARIQALRGELGEVVLASVTKLLGEHLINPQSIRATIEQVLKESGITAPAKVFIAPAQYEQLVKYGAAHLNSLRERRIEIAPDPRVACGGCLIEMANGLADGRFEVQLARLREILMNHYLTGSAAK